MLYRKVMKIVIITPQAKTFDDQAKNISIPTEIGEITIQPAHMPLTTIIKPGLIKILPEDSEKYRQKTFVFEDQYITISSSDGIAYTDGETVTIMVSSATTSWSEDQEIERQNQIKELESQRDEAKTQSDPEKSQRIERKIQTIHSSIKLGKLGKK